MRPRLAELIGAADGDPAASQDSPVGPRLRPERIAWAGIGVAAYVAGLIAMMPAGVVIDPGPRWRVGGSLWRGDAVLAGAYRVGWHLAPLRSLAAVGAVADWRMEGQGTDITGSASLGRRRLLLRDVNGHGDGALLAALLPDLPFGCDIPLTIGMPRILLAGTESRAEGRVASAAGACTPIAAAESLAVPALMARLGETEAVITPLYQPGLRLVEGRLARGRLTIAPTPLGTRLIPMLRGLRVDRTF